MPVKKKKSRGDANVLQTPRPLSYANDNKSSCRQEPPSWSQMSPIALRNILQSLTDEDRASMARVCKSWYEGYYDPVLWRKKKIVFDGRRAEEDIEGEALMSGGEFPLPNAKSAMSFARTFAHYVQELEIHITQFFRYSTDVVGEFMAFAWLLDVANLKKVHIIFYDDNMFEGQRSEQFIKVISRLIKNQHNLKKFGIDFACFEPDHGIKLLKCLAEASGRTLETLFLNNLFVDDADIYRERRIVTELKKFMKLREIDIEYALVADELVQLWSKECPTLAFIKLCAEPQYNIIRDESWQALVGTHPKLLVELNACDYIELEMTPDILTPAIPLCDLTWETDVDFTSEFELTSFFCRVASYHRTIKRISMMFPVDFEIPETFSVHNILSNCSNLHFSVFKFKHPAYEKKQNKKRTTFSNR